MFFVSKSIIGLRFFNIKKNVQSKEQFSFLIRFKDNLEQLGHASGMKEVGHLTQTFFHIAFDVPLTKTRFYVRGIEQDRNDPYFYDTIKAVSVVDKFITKHENELLMQELRSTKIIIRDEIAFTHFYEGKETTGELLAFMNALNADVFLPVFERQMISAFIIIDRNARSEKLFNAKDRDEMSFF